MPVTIRRLTGAAVVAAVALATGGAAWHAWRFGTSPDGPVEAFETEARAIVNTRRDQVETLAEQVAAEPDSIESAISTEADRALLFTRLAVLAGRAGPEISVTVYVAMPSRGYRPIAWSNGPSDSVEPERLTGPASVFLAPGTSGLRLIAVRPVVDSAERRLAVVVAETVVAPVRPGSSGTRTTLSTSFGPVPADLSFSGAGAADDDSRLAISLGDASAVLDLQYDTADLEAERVAGWRRVGAVAIAPFALLALLLTGPILAIRGGARRRRVWADLVASLAVAAGTAGLVWVARLIDAPQGVVPLLLGLGLMALAVLGPVRAWWAPHRRRRPGARPARFLVEQALVALVVAGVLSVVATWIASGPDIAALARWHSPLFPLAPTALLSLTALMVGLIAAGWTVSAVLAWSAERWRLRWFQPATLAAVAIWTLATAILLRLVTAGAPQVPAFIGVLACATAFALSGPKLRQRYRRAAQTTRLALVFAAMCGPVLVFYPLVATDAARRSRTLVAGEYAPATSGHWRHLGTQVAAAQSAIDRVPPAQLIDFVSTPPAEDAIVPSSAAYSLWTQTDLDEARVTSEVELFDQAGRLVSRFALNVPDDRRATTFGPWDRASCDWVSFADVGRIGADDRAMLHAERGVCDPQGQVVGAIVLHVVFDYRSLEFIAPVSPYEQAFAPASSRGPAIPRLEVVAYGWGGTPVFTSDRVAWPAGDLLPRLYASRDPFWTDVRGSDDRLYHVYFTQNRAGIYAIGFPVPTLFAHATRLAELLAVLAVLAAVLLAGATVYAPLAQRREAPLRVLYRDVRTSFYRKLFLLFVLAALGPVVLLALAIGAYVSAQFRADVEAEAATLAATARRVFEDVAAIEERAGAVPVANDEVMVWIAQVLDQDVHLYDGPQLVATSQRNLFDSGLLPPRAPAAAYRAVVLDRLPTAVIEDRLGGSSYLMAAAPVRARGREALLGVPMASRQQQIDRELDDLNRGVLVGAVLVVLLAAGLGSSVASRVSDPVARLTRATRLITAGRLDVRIAADTADELRRLVDDFNRMAETLVAQRAELARTHQVQAWAEMARQVAHEIKNPLTPIQLAAEHLQRVHDDQERPLGPVFDQCITTISRQVDLLRRIASEFSNFAGRPEVRLADASVIDIVEEVLSAYRFDDRVELARAYRPDLPLVRVDRTLVSRALTNVVENARQAMPAGGVLTVSAKTVPGGVVLEVSDTGVGMEPEVASRAFDPYFSTKTGGSGLGLANARRNVELSGGTMALSSVPGRGTSVTLTLPEAPGPDGS